MADTNDEQWPPASGLPAKKRFKRASKIEWGETPFDTLSRAELLRLVQAYHMALTSSRSCLHMAKAAQPDSPYWSDEGSGGRALNQADFLTKLCGDGGMNAASERIYRSFFRVAEVLLFGAAPGSWDDWGIKVDGDEMHAPYRDGEPGYRRIEWRDLLPKPAA